MNFVLEAGFSGSRAPTLFAGTAENEEIDNNLIEAVRDDTTWKVSLDQGNFDRRQTRVSVAVVLKGVWDYILLQVGTRTTRYRNGLGSPAGFTVLQRGGRHSRNDEGRVGQRATIRVALDGCTGYHHKHRELQGHKEPRLGLADLCS